MRLSTTATPCRRAVAKIRRSTARLSGCSQMCGGGTTLRISAPFAIANATNRSASAALAKKSQWTVNPTRGGPLDGGVTERSGAPSAATAAALNATAASAARVRARPPPAPALARMPRP